MPSFMQADFWSLAFEVELLPYIRPVVQIISAGPDEIRWEGPNL